VIKNFTTIFSKLKNVDIIKMPGLIPFYISKLSDKKIECKLVCLNNDDFKYYNAYKDYYDLIILDKEKKNKKPYFHVLRYLFKNSSEIGILNLYHLDTETLLYAFVYKALRRKGKVFLELDADDRIKEFFDKADRRGILKITNRIRPLKKIILNGLIRLSDFIAIETESIYEYLKEKENGKLNNKLFINPYGINAEELEQKLNKEIQKENIVITVGRIGSYQKNNELLLKALRDIKDFKGWKIYFIGPIETEFENNIRELYNNNPEFKGSVVFTGEISDRKLLSEYMQKAKIFCLTSRYESWGIVLNEAAYYGCYIVSTDTGCAREVIKNIADGELISDGNGLQQVLDKAFNGNIKLNGAIKPGAVKYIMNNTWERTVALLMKRIIPDS
jgi:glycosyltransferase involved in cell wall biosynthesis